MRLTAECVKQVDIGWVAKPASQAGSGGWAGGRGNQWRRPDRPCALSWRLPGTASEIERFAMAAVSSASPATRLGLDGEVRRRLAFTGQLRAEDDVGQGGVARPGGESALGLPDAQRCDQAGHVRARRRVRRWAADSTCAMSCRLYHFAGRVDTSRCRATPVPCRRRMARIGQGRRSARRSVRPQSMSERRSATLQRRALGRALPRHQWPVRRSPRGQTQRYRSAVLRDPDAAVHSRAFHRPHRHPEGLDQDAAVAGGLTAVWRQPAIAQAGWPSGAPGHRLGSRALTMRSSSACARATQPGRVRRSSTDSSPRWMCS